MSLVAQAGAAWQPLLCAVSTLAGGWLRYREDRQARVDVLVRLGAHDEAGLPGLEAVVAELGAKLDKFLHFKESCWRNISV